MMDDYDWPSKARAEQLPPDVASNGLPWITWLFLGGRGSGKTRTGAEWVRGLALGRAPFATIPVERIALIGETFSYIHTVMIAGPSGLLAIHPVHERPEFNASRRELIWPNGAVAQLFSADDLESLRGRQFGAIWCDELAKWRYAERIWDILQSGLRLGERPQQVVTTTPRAIPLMARLLTNPSTVVSRAATSDNVANLAPPLLRAITERYQGIRLGRQEVDGETIDI